MKFLKHVNFDWSDQTIMNIDEGQYVIFVFWLIYIAFTFIHVIIVLLYNDNNFNIRKGSYFMIIGYIASNIPATILTILLINPISQAISIFLIVFIVIFLIYGFIFAIIRNDNGDIFIGCLNIFGSFRKYSEDLVEFNNTLETYKKNYKSVTTQII